MFAILDVKSAYSLFDGTISPKDIVEIAVQKGYRAVAINDLNTLHSLMELKSLAEKNKIQPLYSLRVIIENQDNLTYLLYAKNNDGYKDLLKLSTFLARLDTVLTYENLIEYTNDCVVIVYGEGGIIENDSIDTVGYLELFKKTLRDFYIGISNNTSNKWKVDNDKLKDLCNIMNVETVALPKVEFKSLEDVDVKRLYIAMANSRLFLDHQNYVNEKNFFLNLDQIEKFYDKADIQNTIEIANKCQVNFNTIEKADLPVYKNPAGVSSEKYLSNLCIKGLNKRLDNLVTYEYSNRLKHELQIINEMGFADYFLIVYDFILFARKNNIYVGPGRGSSAGSLVAYVLGITHIDPIKYGLLFERFLNPERVSLPDIDIDFPDNKRSLIIDYVSSKYGSEQVAHIITFGTFAAKQSIRDVGKALNIPTYQLDRVSKMIPNTPKIKLSDVYNKNHNFKKFIKEDAKLKQLYYLASKIEGLPRHTSLHAAGIVLSDKPLVNYVPLMQIDKEHNVTQYSMDYLEAIGLNKMDFLGLRNLTIIANVVEKIPNFNIFNIPLDDKKTYDLIADGQTSGIFQLESYGMTKLLKQMQPFEFNDIVAAIALYRPGPMENIPTYLKRRFTKNEITYLHPDLKPILQETYGIIVYQEQIMQIAQKMADFSLAKADILRKAMSDKNATALGSLREEFILGSVKKGYLKKDAIEVYNLIEKFANYGFNKAHSVAYSLIAYQLAYLKTNHYFQFYIALLNSVIGGPKKTREYVLECRRREIKILKPHINYSIDEYIEHQGAILFPLLSIKSVGKLVCDKLLNERKNGLFKDFFDFVARANVIKINKPIIEALIYGGALDSFGHNRTTMIKMLDQALMYADLVKVDAKEVTLDFNIVSKPKILIHKADNFFELEKEKEMLGFYLSTHPIAQKKSDLNYHGDSIIEVKNTRKTKDLLVYVTNIKQHRTKNGFLMAFVSVNDDTDNIDLVLMPNIYKNIEDKLKSESYIRISGKIDRKDSILVNSLNFIE
ncbi:MAG: DNA polymerase III subunit alpha [Erysipelothrix sp.]|nr:DNA polymerase III subunit alpha [Erysipelothrix sp.]